MTDKNAGCLAVILRLIGIDLAPSTKPNSESLPYRLRDDFLSQAELSFFRVLQMAIGDQYTIQAKVNLGDLLFVPGNNSTAYRNKIDRKHVDFLLCDPTSMRPVCAIELDDRSHRRTDRKQRDELVDSAMSAAGLRLVRVTAKEGYNVQEIRELFSSLETPKLPRTPSTLWLSDDAPVCPKCQLQMKRQTARRGTNAGKQFWGCTNYPKCRETVDIPG